MNLSLPFPMTDRTIDTIKSALYILGVLAALVGWAYNIESKIAQKADSSEMAQLRQEIQQVHMETKTIRLILCERAAQDSYCKLGR
jgi:hypothetical protein